MKLRSGPSFTTIRKHQSHSVYSLKTNTTKATDFTSPSESSTEMCSSIYILNWERQRGFISRLAQSLEPFSSESDDNSDNDGNKWHTPMM